MRYITIMDGWSKDVWNFVSRITKAMKMRSIEM